eukprot:1180388-Prorocentrum_minimum.AAC.2
MRGGRARSLNRACLGRRVRSAGRGRCAKRLPPETCSTHPETRLRWRVGRCVKLRLSEQPSRASRDAHRGRRPVGLRFRGPGRVGIRAAGNRALRSLSRMTARVMTRVGRIDAVVTLV